MSEVKELTEPSLERWGLPWHAGVEVSARLLSPNGDVRLEAGSLKYLWPGGAFSKDDAAGNLTALITTGWEIVPVAKPILPRFLYLTDAADEEVLEFAKEWGPLWWWGKPLNPFYRPGALIDGNNLFLGCDADAKNVWKWSGQEDCDLFRSAAWLVLFLTRAVLEQGWELKVEGERKWKKRLGALLVEGVFGKLVRSILDLNPQVAMKILNRLCPAYMMTQEVFSVGKLSLGVKDGFFPVVIAETTKNIVENRERYFTCDECGRFYFREKKLPKPGNQNYCEKCSDRDKASKRGYARRRKQAGKE